MIPGEGAQIRLNMNAPKRAAQGAGVGTRGVDREAAAPEFELSREQVIYQDSQLIVVDKPSGISSVAYEPRERGTLEQLVARYLRQPKVEVVHRLDKETSGLIVFARTREAAKALAQQFRFHTIHRRYTALAHGEVESCTIRSVLLENRGDGLRGSASTCHRVAPGEGREAITHVRAIEAFSHATLIECRLETGRTHQIRIHLSEVGHPLLGEKLYIREFEGELLPASRVMLHAAELGLRHPRTGEEMRCRSELPADFLKCLSELTR
jgi:23S rRNA pseudouridine1911/1915/1917 synthase